MKRVVFLTAVKITLCLLLFLSLGVLSSCDEEGAEYIDQLDLVVTRYDQNFDFSGTKTYVMPDTIVHVPEDGNYSMQDSLFDQTILARVEANMNSLGYVRVMNNLDGTEVSHLLLTLTIIHQDYYGIYGWGGAPWYGYWSWYDWDYWGYSWIGPGWYPYYPGYWGSYAYSTGTLVVDMMQPLVNESDNHIPVLWNGIFDGIYSMGLNDRMLNGIDQMFEQSPYLSQ